MRTLALARLSCCVAPASADIQMPRIHANFTGARAPGVQQQACQLQHHHRAAGLQGGQPGGVCDACARVLEYAPFIMQSPNPRFCWSWTQIGDVVQGVVQSIKPYGAFVDLGGVTGLLHVSQISHERITNVDKVLAEGDKLKVGTGTRHMCSLPSRALAAAAAASRSAGSAGSTGHWAYRGPGGLGACLRVQSGYKLQCTNSDAAARTAAHAQPAPACASLHDCAAWGQIVCTMMRQSRC